MSPTFSSTAVIHEKHFSHIKTHLLLGLKRVLKFPSDQALSVQQQLEPLWMGCATLLTILSSQRFLGTQPDSHADALGGQHRD